MLDTEGSWVYWWRGLLDHGGGACSDTHTGACMRRCCVCNARGGNTAREDAATQHLHDLLPKLFCHLHKLWVGEHAIHGLKVLGRIGGGGGVVTTLCTGCTGCTAEQTLHAFL